MQPVFNQIINKFESFNSEELYMFGRQFDNKPKIHLYVAHWRLMKLPNFF
jgi:hypothetical protein